ncbi:sulfotransferase [Persephonella sp.]
MSQPPVIIIGMHRSGTSLLSRVLEKTGIFMGTKKDENNEALFFLKFNDWVLKQANATWDNPYNYTLADEDFKNLMTGLAKKYIKSLRRIEYLGFKRSLKYRSLEEIDFPWGWKDPRNTFTLDIWLKVFPNAKIIHIYRNPIDVAESLRRRTLKIKKNFKRDFKGNLKFLLTKGYLYYGNSVRVERIDEGIKLWEEYIFRVFEIEKKMNLEMIHIKYEDFLEKPKETLKEIIKFVELDFKEDKLKTITESINPERKYAFLNDIHLVNIYNRIKTNSIMKTLGYNNIKV